MAYQRHSLPVITARVAAFWWVVLSLIEFGSDPRAFITHVHDNFPVLGHRLLSTALFAVIGAALLAFLTYAWRELRRESLRGASLMGVTTTMGPVPRPALDLPRIRTTDKRHHINGKLLQEWIQSQVSYPENKNGKKPNLPEYSPHARLFLAIWDTYCAHSHFPASHRLGGHGDRRLHLHCHDVAEHSLALAKANWRYDGIFVKKRGHKPVKIFTPNSPQSTLNVDDPLIPLVAIAHDIGKLLTYKVDARGRILANSEGDATTLDDDDKRVLHDILGPRILAQMPEFWELDHRDRAALNMALGHYHHPSEIPINQHGLLVDERGAALMALLIDADRQVSAAETGTPLDADSKEMDEHAANDIYEAFVSIITEFGRINGVGDPKEDAEHRIGQKHEHFIAIKESSLRALMQQALNRTIEDGDNRYRLTLDLLVVLRDKDLLYTSHNGVDFVDNLPMYRVGLYHHSKKTHLTDLAPALLIKIPPSTNVELQPLTFLSVHPAVVIVKNLMLAHIRTIRDPQALELKISKAFGGAPPQATSPDKLPYEVETKADPMPKLIADQKGALTTKESQPADSISTKPVRPARKMRKRPSLVEMASADHGRIGNLLAVQATKKPKQRNGDSKATVQPEVTAAGDDPASEVTEADMHRYFNL